MSKNMLLLKTDVYLQRMDMNNNSMANTDVPSPKRAVMAQLAASINHEKVIFRISHQCC